jgi:oligoendopeptidase F
MQKIKRSFLPPDFKITDWQNLVTYYDQLANEKLSSVEDLQNWLLKKSELETVVSEDLAWRYIRMTCDTENKEKREAYDFFITEIEPKIQPYNNKFDLILLQSPYKKELSSEADQIMIKIAENHNSTFREENIPLLTEIQQLQVKYGATVGSLMVTIDGEEMTLQKASTKLLETDRNVREKAYLAIQSKRLSVKNELDQLFDQLVQLRNRVAKNAGFENFRDYMFVEMCRFDYTPKDCIDFHESVASAVVPIINKQAANRKKKLKLEELRPYDLSVDEENRPPLKPFANSRELIDKTIVCFNRLDPSIANVIVEMDKLNRLDLESRKGKAPGGYNYPLYESGYPFIFMNSVGALRDLVTMVHEGGHALHSVLTHPLKLLSYKNFPSEVAELASMSMELLSMEHWDVFFDNESELKRAKKEHLESIIDTLPWVATIDKFQHWIYENPTHSQAQRTQAWVEIYSQFSNSVTNWNGLEQFRENLWQKQLHLFEVPFYYIEYGMAQLGAIAVWRNYKLNPQKGLNQYLDALKLGYTRSIGEIYSTAGVKFDFSPSYIQELMDFVNDELEKLSVD